MVSCCVSSQSTCASSSWRMRSSKSRVPLSPAVRQASMPALSRFTASYSTSRSSWNCSGTVSPTLTLQVWQPLQVQDALDQLVRVLHLLDALLAHSLVEAAVSPVVAEAGVEEVLVDRGQLGRQHVVEQRDDLLVAFHAPGLPSEGGGR